MPVLTARLALRIRRERVFHCDRRKYSWLYRRKGLSAEYSSSSSRSGERTAVLVRVSPASSAQLREHSRGTQADSTTAVRCLTILLLWFSTSGPPSHLPIYGDDITITCDVASKTNFNSNLTAPSDEVAYIFHP